MIFAQGPVTLAPGHGVVNAPERAISRAPTPRRARRAVALRSTLPRHPPWVDHVHNPHFVGSGTAVDVLPRFFLASALMCSTAPVSVIYRDHLSLPLLHV